ncbi:MAG: DNA gyrase inhibitor YacG [Nitrospinota bacterium]|nr:DNA gyrase inhibitor YacG [Nitrospinota bacterium]
MKSKPKPKCPICKKPVVRKGNAFLPFCSEQCRLIDLGQWLDGGYSVPGIDSPSAPDSDSPENN